jgi:hypothetical protein
VKFGFLEEGNVNVVGREEVVDLVGGVSDAVGIELKDIDGGRRGGSSVEN